VCVLVCTRQLQACAKKPVTVCGFDLGLGIARTLSACWERLVRVCHTTLLPARPRLNTPRCDIVLCWREEGGRMRRNQNAIQGEERPLKFRVMVADFCGVAPRRRGGHALKVVRCASGLRRGGVHEWRKRSNIVNGVCALSGVAPARCRGRNTSTTTTFERFIFFQNDVATFPAPPLSLPMSTDCGAS
jgi:hypothetical protein